MLALATCARDVAPALVFEGDLAVEGYDGHRDAAAYTEIAGDLRINAAVTQLSLPNLRRVRGDLSIDAVDLTRIDLPKLREVGGVFTIQGQSKLATVIAPALTTVGGLTIIDNPVLTEFSIPRFASCAGAIALVGNPGLSRLPWGALSRIGGELRIERNRELLGVDLHAVEEIGGDVSIGDHARLIVLQLESLRSVGGRLQIRQADALQRLRAPRLRRIEGALRIVRAGRLRRIEMPQLEEVVGGIGAHELPVLSAFEAPLLTRVGGDLQFTGTPQLTLIDLAGLVQVGESLRVRAVVGAAMQLAQLRLGALAGVGGDLAIRGTALTELDLGTLAAVGGSLSIQDNASLGDLRLGALTDVGGTVRIRGNALPKCVVARFPKALHAKTTTRGITASVIRPDSERCTEGSLSRAQIAAVVDRSRSLINLCLADAGATGHIPPGSYTVRLGWRIQVDGSVTDARILNPSTVTPAADCIQRAMVQWRFAAIAEPIDVDDHSIDVRVQGPWVAGLRVGDMRVSKVLGQDPLQHDEAISAATFANDKAITGSLDGTVRVWDVADGRLLRVLRGHRGAVRAVAMIEPGVLLSSGDDKTLRQWELSSGREQVRIDTDAVVTALAVAPGSVFGGDNRGRIHRWRFSPGRKPKPKASPQANLMYGGVLFAFEGADAISANETIEVTGVAVDGTGAHLFASTQWGQTAAVLVGDGQVLFERTIQGWGRLTALSVSADAKTVFVGGGWGAADDSLRVIDAASGRELRSLIGSGPVTAACLGRDGDIAIVADEVGVELYDTATWMSRARLAEGDAAPTAVAIGAEGSRNVLLVGRESGKVELWSVTSRRNRRTLAGHIGKVEQIRVADNGKRAVSFARDGSVRLWDLTRGKAVATYEAEAVAIAIAGNGKWVGIADERGRVALGAAQDERLIWLGGEPLGRVSELAFSKNDLLVAVSDRGVTSHWKVNTREQLATATFPGEREVLALSDDGALAVSRTHDGVSVWDTRTGEEQQTVATEEPATSVTRFMPGGRAVLVVDKRSLWHWDLRSGKIEFELTGHVREILDVGVAGRRAEAVSVSLDGTLRHWDFAARRAKVVVDMIAYAGDFPSAVALTPSGDILVGKPNGLIFVLESAKRRR